jgi:hypothetical protein
MKEMTANLKIWRVTARYFEVKLHTFVRKKKRTSTIIVVILSSMEVN